MKKSEAVEVAANRRIGRKAVVRYTRDLLRRIESYHEKPTKMARRRYLDAVQALGALALLFEDVAARNYRTISLGAKSKKSPILSQLVR